MTAPINIAAIDAGSNAIRLMIAQARTSREVFELKKTRSAVRLGHNVFTHHAIDEPTMRQAVRTFAQFAQLFEEYEVQKYRAVATSAAREAGNGARLIERIYGETGILLEIIDGVEEARLIMNATLQKLGTGLAPEMIFDLGGGSLDISMLRGGKPVRGLTIPIGTVRLMERFGITGVIDAKTEQKIRRNVLGLLRKHLPEKPDLSGSISVICGGNAEALTRVAPGYLARGIPTLDMRLLDKSVADIQAMSVVKRMKDLSVRRDRAEVMAIAGIVLSTLAHWLKIKFMLVPAVGLREGVIAQLVDTHFHHKKKAARVW